MSETPCTYAADPFLLTLGIRCCVHCGGLPEYAHFSDGRCYTPEEIGGRLAFWQATGRWPGRDEVPPYA